MKWIVLAAGALLGLLVAYVIAHLALIEVGREVVVLHKWTSEWETRRTRLWIVDEGEASWFHHGYADSGWIRRLAKDPVVTVERAGTTRQYRARPDLAAHERVHRLLRSKYGVADWWVRFVTRSMDDCSAVPVRLELVHD